MIYLFSGDDSKRKYLAYENFLGSISKGLEVFFISKNDFDQNQLESFYSGSGLFFSKCVVVLTDLSEDSEKLDFVISKLEEMHSSENVFIFLEGKLSKSILDSFKKARAELDIFELPKMKKEKYDNFLLANALGVRNKFELWFHFRQAMDRGVMMEELVGVLFWKAKDMILKKNFSKFTRQELENFASKISFLVPEARKQGRDAETVFEYFLLNSV